MAARVEREHKWSAETVLPEGNRPVGAFASPSKQSGASAQRTATGDLAIRNPSMGFKQRTFKCSECDYAETDIVKVGPLLKTPDIA